MTWIPLLLTDPSPSLRILVLKNFLNKPESNEEVQELREIQSKDPIIEKILNLQFKDGSWNENILGVNAPGGNLQVTSQQLTRLAFLEYPTEKEVVKKAVDFIFSYQNDDGSWPLPKIKEKGELKGYDMQPLQTIIPLEGIAAAGYATDKRAEKAYDWILNQKLDDGSWPVGLSSGVYGKIAGYRSIAHSRWGCRSTTIGALNCLSYHPSRSHSEETKRALDLILSCESTREGNLGFVVSRTLGFEPSRGWITYYPRLDPAHILKLCVKIGVSFEDKRVQELVDFIKTLKGENGLWECRLHPQANRWLTYDLLQSLKEIKSESDWISHEPSTPFQEYSRKLKRF